MRSSELISSNRIESLAEHLGARLFKIGSRPFERRMIVVPNEELKGYLLHYFARRLDIAAGINIYTLSQSFAELHQTSERSKRIPGFLELSLFLEARISTDTDLRRDFPELEDYLADPSGSSSRLGSLCHQLSVLFARYGLYGKDFLPEWIQEKGWQQSLWNQTFFEQTPWTYPAKALLEPLSSKGQVHLFGFQFLPTVYLSFFQQMGACVYLLSPCALFWEDLSSDKENLLSLRRFKRQGAREVDVEAWKRFAPDAHPLLANWGKWGREFIRQLDLDSEGCFVEPEGNTLLASIQKDILHMHIGEHPDLAADRSIQIHSAPTKLREIEVLYNTLCDLMHHNPDLLPREILVLSPDINEYAPLIHMVFGSEESQLNYSIHGLIGGSLSDVIQAFKHLLALSHSDFSLEDVMKLFDFRCIRQRWEFSAEDVILLNRWASLAQIRRGWDQEESGTWELGLDRLLLGLAMSVSDDQGDLPLFPCPVVDLTEVELLEKWIGMLRLILSDVQRLSDPEPKTMGDWLSLLIELGERYVTSSAATESFFFQLKQLERQLSFIQDRCFTFASVQRIVSQIESSMRSTYFSPHLEKVTFASIANGLMQPAKVVWLLGLDEVSFPRSDPVLSLSVKMHEYISKKIDEDRYSFLNALCLAQEHFIVSYERMSPEDQKSLAPSSQIVELLQCIKRDYKIDPEQLTFHHPSFSFDASYFMGRPGMQSYCPSHFAAAQCYYGPIKKLEPFASFPLEIPQADDPVIFEIKHLKGLARNPVRFFLQKTLGIYMPFEEPEHEEFVASPLLKSFVRKRVLQGGFEEHMRVLKAQGKLPLRAFCSVASSQILEESSTIQKHLSRHQLDQTAFFSVELSLACREPVLRPQGDWILPALRVPLEDGREAVVVGKLDHVSKQAILFDGELDFKHAVRHWPEFLVYHCLSLFSEELEKRVLFTKKGHLKEGRLEHPLEDLARYLAYYERSLRECSWLMPDWAGGLLKLDEKEFARALKNVGDSYGSVKDAYVLWLKRRHALPDPAEVLSAWSEDFHRVFDPMKHLWGLNETQRQK